MMYMYMYAHFNFAWSLIPVSYQEKNNHVFKSLNLLKYITLYCFMCSL